MPISEPFRNLPPIANMDATVDSSPPAPGSVDKSTDDPKTPLLIRTHLPSSTIEAFGVIGGYRLLEKLGEGGMGTVYLAEDVTLNRRVALKVMKPNIASEPISRERFMREARAAAQLDHDNIVGIHQVNEENGVPYLAMPLLKGESLGAYLQRVPRPDLAFILKISRDVALGLAAAHAQGLVHRDIKPDNIWIEPIPHEEGGTNFRGKILDFGLARPRLEDGALLTRQGAFLGTPAYVAPEQARGQDVDNRADLFSLGCVMYEMTAGSRPFRGVDTMAVLTSLISDTPREPRLLNAEVPPALSMLIMQLLEKDANRRPGNARIVADSLKQVQPGLMSSATVPLPPVPGLVRVEGGWRREEPRSMLPWFMFGVLILLGAGAYAFYKYVPPAGPGVLQIDVDSGDVEARYLSKGNIKILDSNGQLKKTLKPAERKLPNLPAGMYRAELTGTEGLQLRWIDAGIEKNDIKLEFRIDPGQTTNLRVTTVSPFKLDVSPGSKK